MFRQILTAMASGSIAIMLAPVGAAYASTILIDDFNDGNEYGWDRLNLLPPAARPGIFDTGSGEYRIQSTGLTDNEGLGSFWAASVDPLYSNGLVRAKIRTESAGAIVGATMRNRPTSGYFFAGNSFTHDFFMGRSDAGQWVGLRMPDVIFNAGEEWMIEAGIVGDQASMKVWRPDDPEPSSPQLMITDPEPLPLLFGEFGIVSWVGPGNPPARIDATFDDIYFTHIPASGLLEDFNGDGEVNFADFLQFADSYGSMETAELLLFDLDTSGKVDFADFLQFSSAYGQMAQASAVPEPNSLVITTFGLLVTLGIRRNPT